MDNNILREKVREIVFSVAFENQGVSYNNLSDDDDLFEEGVLSSISLIFVADKISQELDVEILTSATSLEKFRNINAILSTVLEVKS